MSRSVSFFLLVSVAYKYGVWLLVTGLIKYRVFKLLSNKQSIHVSWREHASVVFIQVRGIRSIFTNKEFMEAGTKKSLLPIYGVWLFVIESLLSIYGVEALQLLQEIDRYPVVRTLSLESKTSIFQNIFNILSFFVISNWACANTFCGK